MTRTWLQEASERFWSDAGGSAVFPRNMEKAAVYALPLGIISLPRLWISDLVCWMERRRLQCPLEGNDRPLRGCLLAFSGRGLVIINGQDPDDERRFTAAHEVAHFILDYLEVRKRVIESLGTGALEVLDGIRPATYEERLNAVLSSTLIGVHTHTMDRTPEGDISQGSVLRIEEDADLLALELLAPAEQVQFRLHSTKTGRSFSELMPYAERLLQEDYGLPKSAAKPYAYQLVDNLTHGPSIKEWLGLGK
jgi:Zn-dependent peptidase ImmA (M78 family)